MITQEQKAILTKQLDQFGVAILDKVAGTLTATTTKVTAFVETEVQSRVAADNEILSQIENVKAINEGKANGYVYIGDESDVDKKDVTDILKESGKSNFNDMTYVLKNVGDKDRTVFATVNGEQKEYVLSNQDALIVAFSKKQDIVNVVLDNNTFDIKLQNAQDQNDVTFAKNTDLEDLSETLTSAVNQAIASVFAYQFA